MEGWIDRWTDGWMDGWMNKQTTEKYPLGQRHLQSVELC